MSIKRVTPDEAAKLLAEGWKYVDVRTVLEFEAGHPSGAFNVPIMLKGPTGMAANPEFARVMKAAFSGEDKLVLGCRSGQRSLLAAQQLAAEGFETVVDMRGGFAGERAPSGAVTCEGWQSRNLPVSTEPETGRSYNELKG